MRALALLYRRVVAVRFALPAPAVSLSDTQPADEAGDDAQTPVPLPFWRPDEAERYLRFWRRDGAAMQDLRGLLSRVASRRHLLAEDDDAVLRGLSVQIAAGRLQVFAGDMSEPEGPVIVLPGGSQAAAASAAAAAVAAAAAPATAVPTAAAMPPSAVSQLPILPVLEEVQIEGADVLPEIEQSLEQVALTIESIDLASVSLEPTPSDIPGIRTALADAGGAVTADLDAL